MIYLLSKAFNYPVIDIISDSVIHTNFNPQKVGAAFSGGIDSLATLINHSGDDCPDAFKISQLALFNVGAFGNDHEKSLKSFNEDIKRAVEFASYLKMPLITVDSNIAELYTHKVIYHNSVHVVFCLLSAIIELQKLWKVYYISSSYRIETTSVDPDSSEHFECLLTQLLSNNNFQIFSAETYMSRVEKTELVAKSDMAKKFLYVCSMDIFNNNHGMNKTKTDKLNCSECSKCYWTMLTLDYLGYLKDFVGVFDLERYYKVKKHLEYTYYGKTDSMIEQEIVDLMIEKGWRPPLWLKITKQMEKSRMLSWIIGRVYHIGLLLRHKDTYNIIMSNKFKIEK